MTFLNVALSEDYAFVGEPYNYENNSFSGIVYVIQNSTTDIQDFIGDIQSCSFSIRNFPNPFNPITTIEFSIQNDSKIELSIYNIKGQKIKTLIQNEYLKGTHSIIWNGADESNNPVSSGIYYYKLNVNGKTEVVKKCLLLK